MNSVVETVAVRRRGWHPVPAAPDLAAAAEGVILFDGVCVLCSRWVRFVFARDLDAARFRYTAVQSPFGAVLARRLGIDVAEPETNAVVLDGRAYFKSDAAIEVLRRLPRWRWAVLLRLVPRPLRDWLYDRVARNRYDWFGHSESCLVPTPELRRRIVTEIAVPGVAAP